MRFIAAILLIAVPCAPADSPQEFARKARQAEKTGDIANAYRYYTQAAALAPDDSTFWARSQVLRTRALLGATLPPPAALQALADQDVDATASESPLGAITAEDMEEARRFLPPVELQGDPSSHAMEFDGDARQLWTAFAGAYGVSVIFDQQYRAGSRQRLRTGEVDFRQALHILSTATNSFAAPIGEKLMLVANDTPDNRRDLEPTVTAVVPLPETLSVQETQELAQAVQQATEIQRLIVDPDRGMVLMRDRVSKVRPAMLLFERMLRRRPEVVVEVEFIEVGENSSLRYGIGLPTSFPLAWLGELKGFFTVVPSLAPAGARLASLGGGATLFGLGLANAELFASMTRGSSHSLMRSTVRTTDGQQATLHVGTQFPVITSGYFGEVQGSGEVYRPPPSITFEDLGVVLSVTPRVHGSDEVTLELEAEYKVLAGTALNGIPIIANRGFQGIVRVRAGEWAVMSGLAEASQVRALSGIAGLAQIPVLGPLFRRTTATNERRDALLVLKPHLVSLPPPDTSFVPIWTGTESRPRTSM